MKTLNIIFAVVVICVAGVMAFGVIGSVFTKPAAKPLISQLPVQKVLQEIKNGKRVVFVDVRERKEYLEFHIPGALNFPNRDLTPDKRVYFEDADYVIPYCLKDFRGFEGGRLLLKMGIERVHLIEGFGINSWKHSGMPVSGTASGKTELEGLREMGLVLDASGQGE